MKSDVRLFAPFPIEMDEHPKIMPLSDAAFRALFEATFYSRRMLSDGFLDERVVLKRWGQAVADELSTNDPERPSWVRVERGWQIHDFDKHHPMRADIEAKRSSVSKARSEAGQSGNQKRWAGNDVATESQSDRKTVAKYRSETETETETTTTDVVVTAQKRGTRIPQPFIVTTEMREWAAQRVPGVNVNTATEKFVNYWRAKTRDGTKLDWRATWDNWLISDFEKLAPTKTRTEQNLTIVQQYAQREQAGIGA